MFKSWVVENKKNDVSKADWVKKRVTWNDQVRNVNSILGKWEAMGESDQGNEMALEWM